MCSKICNVTQVCSTYNVLEDNLSVLLWPCDLCLRLIIGYVMHPDGRMDTVSSTDFELWRLGEDGKDPTHFAFTFTAGGWVGHGPQQSTHHLNTVPSISSFWLLFLASVSF